MSLCVPQFDLVPINFEESFTNSVQANDDEVESILSLICVGIFGLEPSFPIHEDAHFLEKDFLVKREVKKIAFVVSNHTQADPFFSIANKVIQSFVPCSIILSKYIEYLALLHYF
jgi:hypothetical protein